jgi:hypothetical protein
VAWTAAHDAEAGGTISGQWYIYPGAGNVSDLHDYGWHFDETAGARFGARDYNYAGDAGDDAHFRVETTMAPVLPIRFKVERYPGNECMVRATPQFLYGGQVGTMSGGEIHYMHLAPNSRPVNPVYTPWITEADLNHYIHVGTLDDCGVEQGSEHLHQSADLEELAADDVEVLRVSGANDTCWANTDNWFNCPSTYRRHQTCSTWSGTAGISGNITQYICENWSLENRDFKSGTFQQTWRI